MLEGSWLGIISTTTWFLVQPSEMPLVLPLDSFLFLMN